MRTNKLKILILYYIPLDTFKASNWNDGFTSAIKQLEYSFCISWHNLASGNPKLNYINDHDFIIVKSNWNWIVDKYLRTLKNKVKTAKGICISGVALPPSIEEMRFYDVLFYETEWYKSQIIAHPLIVQAFGIDTSRIFPMETDKKFDWLTIGALQPYKRLEKFATREGKKAFVGELNTSHPELYELLISSNVEIIPFTSYDKMGEIICSSKKVYIPAEIQGGGERAVLEARACHIPVEVEPDNPKLQELLTSPIHDHHYYAQQLSYGINKALEARKSKGWFKKLINGVFNY